MKFIVRKRPTGVDEPAEPQIPTVQKIQSSIEDPPVQRRDNEVHIPADPVRSVPTMRVTAESMASPWKRSSRSQESSRRVRTRLLRVWKVLLHFT